MTEVSVSKKTFNTFLDTFGKDLEDIALVVKGTVITARVGAMTHYIRRSCPAEVEEGGNIHISDLAKLRTFLKSDKADNLSLVQYTINGTLSVKCGNSTLQLPGTSYIKSLKEVSLIEKLIEKSEGVNWSRWVDDDLSCRGLVNSRDLRPVEKMAKVLGDKLTCKMRYDPHDREIVFHAGKSTSGKMFVRAPLLDAEGPDSGVESTFAHWLPTLVSTVPEGTVDIHTGTSTVLVIRQEESDYLLLVMDQQFEED